MYQRKSRITLSEDTITDTIFLTSPYSEEFVDEFKFVVPYEARNPNEPDGAGRGWDREERRWGFDVEYLSDVERLLKEHFPLITVEWE